MAHLDSEMKKEFQIFKASVGKKENLSTKKSDFFNLFYESLQSLAKVLKIFRVFATKVLSLINIRHHACPLITC